MTTVEQSKGDKRAHGTHDYPEPLHEITQDTWDVVIIGAGPAGLMSAVSAVQRPAMPRGAVICSASLAYTDL